MLPRVVLLRAALLLVALLPPRRRRKRRRPRRRSVSLLDMFSSIYSQMTFSQEESDDDMGFGLFD